MVFSQPHWSLEQLATIRASVLLINGEHDLVLLPYATEMKNAIPGARLEIIPGGTHEVPLGGPGRREPDHAVVPQAGALSRTARATSERV